MKKRNLFFNLIILALVGFSMTSCSSDDDAVSKENNVVTVTPVKTPDVTIYSGSKTLYSTFTQQKALKAMTLAAEEVSRSTIANDQVEVNLSVNAPNANGDFIFTKLSIHLRAVTDAEVVIPIETKYYDSNANGISTDKNKDTEVSSKSNTKVSYTVNGQPVSVEISYDTDGIHVKTSGFNQAALDYLKGAYGDGITFEVWNYYNATVDNKVVTRTSLKSDYFDKATVSFTNGTPGYYVNAFAAINDYTGKVYGKRDAETGVWTPYTDEACTQKLDTKYWTREGAADAREYILKTHVNEWDCTVTATGYSSVTVTDGKLSEKYYKVYKKL